MDRLEQKHIDFIRTCAEKPMSIHTLPISISPMEADAIANEGLLIRYARPTGNRYAIGRYGAQFIKEGYGASESPEMKKLAVDFVVSKGYEEPAATKIVAEHGVEYILKSQADELREGTQKEVKIPTNAQGKAEIKFKG